MHPTRHLILNTQTWEDEYEICNLVYLSAGGPGLITDQISAHVNSVCIIQKQAKNGDGVYVYTFKTSTTEVLLSKPKIWIKYKVLVQQWRNSREANVNRTAARIWFLYIYIFFFEAWFCFTMTTASGIWALVFWLTLGNCIVGKRPLPRLEWNTRWTMISMCYWREFRPVRRIWKKACVCLLMSKYYNDFFSLIQ